MSTWGGWCQGSRRGAMGTRGAVLVGGAVVHQDEDGVDEVLRRVCQARGHVVEEGTRRCCQHRACWTEEVDVDEVSHQACQTRGHIVDEGTRRCCQHRAS